MKIEISDSPFYFGPIKQIFDQLKLSPPNNFLGTAFLLIDPLNKNYRKYQENSHLTDQQGVHEKIRYLGLQEIHRKIERLALFLTSKIDDKKLDLYIYSPSSLTTEFLHFLNTIKSFDFYISINFQQHNLLPSLNHSTSTANAELKKTPFYTVDDIRTIINSGDYYSAIELLNKLNTADKDTLFKCEIEALLGACNEFLGRTFNAEKHWRFAFEFGNLDHRYRASYSLAMLYIRHHPKTHQNVELGMKFLDDAYQELELSTEFSEFELTIRKTFNRNGYALALFRLGYVDKAQKTVESCISVLNNHPNKQSNFHKTVLLYNLYQCHIVRNEYDNAEDKLIELIKIDPQFIMYRECLIDFYLDREAYVEMEKACIESILIDDCHYKFHRYLGVCFYLQGKLKDAESSLKKSTSLNPLDMSSFCLLTSIWIKLKRFNKVLDVASKLPHHDLNATTKTVLSENIKFALSKQ